MDAKLRRATPADAEELARIHVAAWHEACGGIVPEATLEQFTVEVRMERFRTFLAEGTAETYLAERDAKGEHTFARPAFLPNCRSPQGQSNHCNPVNP